MDEKKPENPFLIDFFGPGEVHSNITLRDLIAMTKQLTPADLACIEYHDAKGNAAEAEASLRYSYADAMLAEREK